MYPTNYLAYQAVQMQPQVQSFFDMGAVYSKMYQEAVKANYNAADGLIAKFFTSLGRYVLKV